MQAIILVGGEGTRLRPLTFDAPKQMLPLLGRPLIEHVCSFLAGHGIDEVVLSLGYLPDKFIEAYPDGRIGDVTLRYVTEPAPLDTAGAIRFAAVAANVTGTFVVINGDVLTSLDLSALVAFHRARGAEATIALTPVEDPSRFGVVSTDEEGCVQAFIEKPPRDEAPTNTINAGVYVFEPSVLARIAPEGRVSVERDTFPKLAADGALFAKVDHAYWLDTGTPTAYLQAHRDYLADPTTDGVVGGSWMHPSAMVDDTADVRASSIGAGCRVGANAVIEGSVLLPGSVVENGAVIRDSILGFRATVGERAHVGELSVVGPDVTVEADASLVGEVRSAS